MIRSTPHSRMGLVTAQASSALDYSYDTDGLSNDPRLPAYLQSLTPAQLQSALNGGTPSLADMMGTPTILTTCQQDYNPEICGPGGPATTNPLAMSLGLSSNSILGAVPGWVLPAALGVGALVLFGAMKR